MPGHTELGIGSSLYFVNCFLQSIKEKRWLVAWQGGGNTGWLLFGLALGPCCAAQSSSPVPQGNSLCTGRACTWRKGTWAAALPCCVRGGRWPHQGLLSCPHTSTDDLGEELLPSHCWTPSPLCTLLDAAVAAVCPNPGRSSHCQSRVSSLLHTPSSCHWHGCSRNCGAQLHSVYRIAAGRGRTRVPATQDITQTCGQAPGVGTTLTSGSSSWSPPLDKPLLPPSLTPAPAPPSPGTDWGPQSQGHTMVPALLQGSEAERSHVDWGTR